MGIFDRLRQKKATVPKAAEDDTKVQKELDKVAAVKKAEQTKTQKAAKKTTAGQINETVELKVAAGGPAGEAYRVLLTPHVSEKAAESTTMGTYVFDVPVTVNKIEIRHAVEALYKVDVEQVRVIRGYGKKIRRGRLSGERAKWKKALVTLKSGQKIDLYEGV